MNDCPNAEIRDQLPDLLHERLDASARAAVVAHIATCVDCRDELQLLRDVRGTLERDVPRVDVAYVVGALPKAPVPSARVAPRRRMWADWRVAAAVTLLVAGGSSAVLLERGGLSAPATVTAPTTVANVGSESTVTLPSNQTGGAAVATPAARNVAVVGASGTPTDAGAGASTTLAERATDAVGGGNRLSDLNENQLQALLKDIGNLKPVPVTDPEPVVLPVNSQSSSEGT